MKILGIETSSPVFSLCLNHDDTTLREFRQRREVGGHGDAEIFKEAEILLRVLEREKLGAIAVSIGPGMFTSLRVGLSLAKGIALVRKTPLVAVNTLDVIGLKASRPGQCIAAVVNAYRGEIYAAFYDNGQRSSDYLLTTPVELMEAVGDQAIVVGPGLEVVAGVQTSHPGVDFERGKKYLPDAAGVVRTALPRIQKGDFDDIRFLEPYYIKKTDAERNYHKGNAL